MKSENYFHFLGLSHEDTWRRVGSGLHLLHQHLQSHVQQQLSEYLQRIQRFGGQQCKYIAHMYVSGFHPDPLYQRDLTLLLGVSVTTTETL